MIETNLGSSSLEEKRDVFISYARADYKDSENNLIPGNPISEIKNALDANEISYWIDETGISAKEEFPEILATAIENCSVFVFVSTSKSNDPKRWTSKEIGYANELQKIIIPFVCDDAPYSKGIRLFLSNIDKCEYNKNKTEALQKLVRTIREFVPESHSEVSKDATPDYMTLKSLIEASHKQLTEKIEELTRRVEELEGIYNREIDANQNASDEHSTVLTHRISSDAHIIFLVDPSISVENMEKLNLNMSLALSKLHLICKKMANRDFMISMIKPHSGIAWNHKELKNWEWINLNSVLNSSINNAFSALNKSLSRSQGIIKHMDKNENVLIIVITSKNAGYIDDYGLKALMSNLIFKESQRYLIALNGQSMETLSGKFKVIPQKEISNINETLSNIFSSFLLQLAINE